MFAMFLNWHKESSGIISLTVLLLLTLMGLFTSCLEPMFQSVKFNFVNHSKDTVLVYCSTDYYQPHAIYAQHDTVFINETKPMKFTYYLPGSEEGPKCLIVAVYKKQTIDSLLNVGTMTTNIPDGIYRYNMALFEEELIIEYK